MTPDLALSAVNVVVDFLVAIAIGTVHRHRRHGFTRFLFLAFVVWMVNDLVEVLLQLDLVEYSVVFFNLSTLHSACFLMALAHLRRSEGGRWCGPGGVWRSDLVNPITLASAGVIVATWALHLAAPRAPYYVVPDLLFATFMWVVMGWDIHRYVRASGRAVVALALLTFGVLTTLVITYLLSAFSILGPEFYLPSKLASVLAHLLIIYIIAHVVARGLWSRLVAEQQDHAQLVESSPTAILVVAEDGAVERVNATGKRVLALPPSERLPHIDELLPELGWSPERVELLASGAVLGEHVTVNPGDPKGECHLRIYVARLSAQTGVEGRPVRRRYVLIATDIGDELERERVAMEAERAKTLSVLSSGTIHHFHNKLLAIRTGLRFVQSRMSLEDGERLRLGMLLRSTDQAFTLSQQLAGSLKLARGSEFETIDLRATLDQAIANTDARRPPSCRVDVIDETDGPVDQPVLVRGVTDFLRMAFENVILNAFDALRPGVEGRVTVRVGADASTAHVRVEDNGTGVPEAARHQVFVPFFTTKEDAGGTGFGLYWSRRLVESMGGSLNIEWTEVGSGTRFGLDLPLCTGQLEASTPTSKVSDDEKPRSGDVTPSTVG